MKIVYVSCHATFHVPENSEKLLSGEMKREIGNNVTAEFPIQ